MSSLPIDNERIYRQRFADASRRKRNAMWSVLCRVTLQRHVDPEGTVVDIGAGSCEFINNIRCRRKIAVDANPDVRLHAAEGVEIVNGAVPAVLSRIPDASVECVFSSNFFEHLPDKAALAAVLQHAHRMLVPNGRLIVLMPNIRYAYKEYWDFLDHHLPLSHKSLEEILKLTGFEVEIVRPRFLPYTTRSRVPQAAWLVRLYLALPPAQWLFGKQMLVIARKAAVAAAS